MADAGEEQEASHCDVVTLYPRVAASISFGRRFPPR